MIKFLYVILLIILFIIVKHSYIDNKVIKVPVWLIILYTFVLIITPNNPIASIFLIMFASILYVIYLAELIIGELTFKYTPFIIKWYKKVVNFINKLINISI